MLAPEEPFTLLLEESYHERYISKEHLSQPRNLFDHSGLRYKGKGAPQASAFPRIHPPETVHPARAHTNSTERHLTGGHALDAEAEA